MAGRPRRPMHMSTSRRRPVTAEKSLAGAVAVVAGATRGAGRGIARALGEAGATVYCTGRSVRANRSPYNRPETVEETAETIGAAGGSAIALRVDHTVEEEVEALFQRVERERGRLDVLVNSIAGEDPLMAQWCSFWKTDLRNAETVLRQSLLSHIITAKHAAPYMIRNRRGLIVEVTENDVLSAGGNPVTQTVKLALKGLALNMAAELRPHGVAAVAVTPGFLGSETMLERERTGQLFSSWDLGREYRFTDIDGRRPDWGASEIDFSKHPEQLLQLLRTGSAIQLRWLSKLRRKTKQFLTRLPQTKTKAVRVQR